MNEDKLDTLLDKCESPIESKLLTQLYPHLSTAHTRELCAQYIIGKYPEIPVTIPDFAFPDMQIAIYCDGFESREDNRAAFRRDRFQSRELQLRGWIVLRFAGSEINRDSEIVVDTIQRAIARRDRQQARWTQQQQQERQHPKIAIPEPPPEPQERPAKQTRQPWQDHQRRQKPQPQEKTEGGGQNQQPQTPPVRQAEKGWQESMQEWRNEKLQATPKQQRKHQAQQKPEGGMCGVVFLASVIVGVLVLLNFIF